MGKFESEQQCCWLGGVRGNAADERGELASFGARRSVTVQQWDNFWSASGARALQGVAAQIAMERIPTVSGTTNLIDILDRVLDKGLVIAGDIRVSLANVELLTIRIRLLVCSVDKAEQIGLNWWKFDPNLTQQAVAAPRTRRQLPAARPTLLRPRRRSSARVARKRKK